MCNMEAEGDVNSACSLRCLEGVAPSPTARSMPSDRACWTVVPTINIFSIIVPTERSPTRMYSVRTHVRIRYPYLRWGKGSTHQNDKEEDAHKPSIDWQTFRLGTRRSRIGNLSTQLEGVSVDSIV